MQGPGELERLVLHTEKYGERVFAVIDEYFYDEYSGKIRDMYKKSGKTFDCYCYRTEITEARIREAVGSAEAFQAEVIVGMGGGKAIDLAKCLASRLKTPLIVIPTSASTDAPTSAMAIVYTEQHEHDDVYYFTKNPDMVLVDSQIVADAPVRFLVSGMGDALATVFEGRASVQTDSGNYICGETGIYRQTLTSRAIAKECYRTILENGLMARISNENHVVTEALEAVIEANTLMSGLGFENVGCAASHCVCNGLTRLPEGSLTLHGEKVAFGVICQLIAEHAPQRELDQVIRFNMSVGLPVTLEDLGVEASDENISLIAGNPQETEWTREPFYTDHKIVADVIKGADALGKFYKSQDKIGPGQGRRLWP